MPTFGAFTVENGGFTYSGAKFGAFTVENGGFTYSGAKFGPFRVGIQYTNVLHVDELRITAGIARPNSAPPGREFPDS